MTFIITTSSIAEASIAEVGLPVVTLGLAVPAPPTSLTATADGTNPQYVDLAWTASASAPVTGYKVFRALGGSGSYSQIGTTASTSYDDDTTAASTEYDYYVVAYNNAGDSAASNVDTITTGSAIAAPANLAVTLVNDTGVLTWDAVSGADGYKVERTLTGAGSWSEIDDVATNTATDTYSAVDTGYDYRVRAYIGASNGPYSSTLSGVYSPILYCTFTAANGTRVDSAGLPDIGSNDYSLVTFTSGTSDLEVLANQLVRSTGTGVKWGMYDTGRATFKSKVDVIYNGTTYVQVVRYSATNLCFAVYFGPGSGGSIIIYKSSGSAPGSFSEVARNDGLGTPSGTYEFIIDNSATAISVTVTGYGTLTYNTTDYNTYTSAGLYVATTSGLQTAFDNHVIWRPQ